MLSVDGSARVSKPGILEGMASTTLRLYLKDTLRAGRPTPAAPACSGCREVEALGSGL